MLHEHLRSVVEAAPPGNGLALAGRHTRYVDLLARIERLAAGFADRGLGMGDAVALLMPNGPDIFVVAHALFAIGAVAMPLSTAATRHEIVHATQKARARAIVTIPELAGLAGDFAATDPARPLSVFVTAGEGRNALAVLEQSVPVRLPTLTGATPALYLLSSGSTGLPKIVPHTHAALLADGQRTSGAWQISPEDRVFNMLPSNFAMGLLLGVADALHVGASVVYWHDPRPLALSRKALLDCLVTEKISLMGAVPAMYGMLADTPNAPRLDLRLSFSGGAPLSRAVFERARDALGLTLRQAYGSTEAIMVAHNDAADIDRLWASVGRPAGDAEIRIDPESGELLIRSSSMTSGYLDAPADNAASFRDGWLLSGDLARQDEEGNLFITGRSKLLIEVSGYKVDPIEVERTLETHPAVAEAVLVGIEDDVGKPRRLKAFVVPQGDVGEDVLLRFLRERLSPQKVPAAIEFRDALPKSSAGKVQRAKLTP